MDFFLPKMYIVPCFLGYISKKIYIFAPPNAQVVELVDTSDSKSDSSECGFDSRLEYCKSFKNVVFKGFFNFKGYL